MFIDSLDTKDSSIYRVNKYLLNKWSANHPIINPNGKAFAVKINQKFTQISHKNNSFSTPDPTTLKFKNTSRISALLIFNNQTFLTTSGSTRKMIKTLPNKTAPAIDMISYSAFKCLPSNFILSQTKSINGCHRLSYFSSP